MTSQNPDAASVRNRFWEKIKNIGMTIPVEKLKTRLSRHGKSLLRTLTPAKVLTGILTVLIAVIVFGELGAIGYRFSLFTTEGSIYVDSPEVYTRERLVNDRYHHDHWLRKQLVKLDQAENLLSGRILRRSGISHSAVETPGRMEDIPIPIDQEFEIRLSLRDTIRQQIMENMLDDRHDLTGNTVYALKFDTTVVPGDNTRKRAFIHISFHLEDLFNLPHIARVVYESTDSIGKNTNGSVARPYQLYESWLENIEYRLNNYASEIYELACSIKAGSELADQDGSQDCSDVAAITLESVLGIPPGSALIDLTASRSADGNFIRFQSIADSWSRFMRVKLKLDNTDRPHFTIQKQADFLMIHPSDLSCGQNLHLVQKYHDFKLDSSDEVTSYSLHSYFGQPHYPVDRDLARTLQKSPQGREISAGCRLLVFEAGFFNFFDSILKTDAYSYAILPRNTVSGFQSSRAATVGINPVGGDDSGVFFLAGVTDQANTVSTLVGYGDSRPDEQTGGGIWERFFAPEQDRASPKRVQFGWVLGTPDGIETMQNAQVALVSVPAWSSQLKLNVVTGWLDRSGKPVPRESYDTTVELPPDYVAFDTFVGGSHVRRQPKILQELFDPIEILACRSARILIPGFRLWRSATVTLGAQSADQIKVMPNMRGLIAEFARVSIPTTRRDDAQGVDTDRPGHIVPLRVWTSEGVDTVTDKVRVLTPPSDSCVDSG